MKFRIAITIGLLLGHTIGWLGLPSDADAVSHTVLISEVQMSGAGTGHASEEFIEIYNASSIPQNLEKYTVKYHASSATDCSAGWQTKYTFGATTLPAFSYWLLAANGYMTTVDGRFAAGLASTSGAVRINDASGQAVDTLGWGSTNTCAEGTPIAPVKDGSSFERRPGEDNPLAGNGIDTDSNTGDFIPRLFPEPQSSLSSTEDATIASEQLVPQTTPTYLPLTITELLIDPVSPQTDAADEYIELYNPNSEPVQLANYELTTGTNRYHLVPTILPANTYLVVTTQISKLALSNSGGQLTLNDPAGAMLDTTAPWPTAVPGATWALFDDGWRWSATATPATENIRDDIDGPDTTGSTAPIEYPVIRLSELLPNPAEPSTDTKDEYIEILNPNEVAVELKGYTIKTGSSLGNSYTLSSQTIGAGERIVITSGNSPLTLANDGSIVAIYNPNGELMDTTTYTSAQEGSAWAYIDGAWAWTSTPTPSSENVYTVTVVPAVTATSTKASTKAKKATKAAAVAKTSTKKVATSKTPDSGAVLGTTNSPANNPWLLFVLAGLTMCYIIYEFRYDIRNYYYRLRGHQEPSR